ncbi:MAG: 30S ribosomal protein S12 methylthiotransferase RimO [Candidatus Brocadiia bacterium]
MAKRHDRRPRLGLVSLGCAKNEVDAERILGAAAEAGWLICADPADADAVVVNTCAFIHAAREESLAALRGALALKRRGRCKAVVVAGCLAQRLGRELRHELPEVDAWVGLAGARDVPRIAAALLRNRGEPALHIEPLAPTFGEEGSRLRITPRHYAYLRIAEGCENRCAYCAIPLIRGPLRSKPLETCLEEARQLADDGCRELILIAQDTTNYGLDLTGRRELPRLLDRLAGLEAFHWLRVLYSHPAHFDDATLEAFATTPHLCHYVDIPVQHASDRILERMGRGTTRQAMADLVGRLRRRIPDVVLRTTVLVGYPGETEADFEALLGFIRGAAFERLGAFAYSPERGTRAEAQGPAVPEAERQARLDEVMRAQQPIAFRHNARRVGERTEVVVDAALGPGRFEARSTAEAPDVDGVVRLEAEKLEPGSFVEVRITQADGYDLEARARSPATRGEDRHGPTA